MVEFRTKEAKKRKLLNSEPDLISEVPRKLQQRRDSYGCVDWQPSSFGSGETTATQKSKQCQRLKDLSKVVAYDQTEVGVLMEETYSSLRLELNVQEPIGQILKDWTFLMEPHKKN